MLRIESGPLVNFWKNKLAEEVGFNDGFYNQESSELEVEESLRPAYKKGLNAGRTFRGVLSSKDVFNAGS